MQFSLSLSLLLLRLESEHTICSCSGARLSFRFALEAGSHAILVLAFHGVGGASMELDGALGRKSAALAHSIAIALVQKCSTGPVGNDDNAAPGVAIACRHCHCYCRSASTATATAIAVAIAIAIALAIAIAVAIAVSIAIAIAIAVSIAIALANRFAGKSTLAVSKRTPVDQKQPY